MTGRLARCTGCGAPILYRFTESGKFMPLDPDPVPAAPGAYVLEGEQYCRPSQPMFDDPDTVHRMSHWATCPNADQFRQPKGGRR